jgi:thymidylate kinase
MDLLFTSNRHRGKLIVVEGIDGSGKSTKTSPLSGWLRLSGFAVAFSKWSARRYG